MYFPVQHYLRVTTENALAKLETEPPLHHMVLRSFECAESLLLLAETQTPRLKGKLTHGRPRFALAVLVKLLAIMPERYHTQTYLLEIIGVLLSESSLNKIAQRVHVSDGSQFLPILAAVAYECDMFPEELQDAMDAILAAVYNEIRQACELLVSREAVLKDIHTRNLNAAAPSSSPSSRRSANPFQDTHRLLLENLRRSSTGLSRKDLRNFKCAPYADELSTAGKKRSNPVSAGHKHGERCSSTSSSP
ncbi:hypothetical protein C8R46DRAFT_657462 [Mycena filopes]|nr:hypothetical protein C8R46DRAFT_657462 [Mycena filopes]